jgi:poly(3-hydroxybutyrate) depolymerase
MAGRQSSLPTIEIKEGLAISNVISPGRVPVGLDTVLFQYIKGQWALPKVGDQIPSARNGYATWHHVNAGKDGGFDGLASGYFATTVEVPDDCNMLLEASGDSVAYVNGVPRAGDPYGYGYLKLPVRLTKGTNLVTFVVGRGQFRAKFTAPRAPVQIDTGDLTFPDVIVDGPKSLLAGVVLLNSTDKPRRVRVVSRNSADETATVAALIPAMSLRKIPVRLVVPDGQLGKEQKFQLECKELGVTDSASITLQVKNANETHRETFISGIDGSLQYYAVNPAQKPGRSNALVLSLHGAGVEAIGQASAYSNKDWCTLVAATNRRPYGFDWEEIGRLDALEVLDRSKKEFPHDPASVHLTGHSMGGHGTWSIGTLYPDLFASIAPSAAWISFWSYADGYKPTKPTPVEAELVRSMAGSDTLGRVENTLEEKVYVLHGDVDDNVPVSEAREMKRVLTGIHADFVYHEQPGASHWWGPQCVDWPGIFDQIRTSKIPARQAIDFTTPSPAISSHDEWVTVLEQIHPMVTSKVKIDTRTGTTENVAALQLNRSFDSLTLDGQELGRLHKGAQLIRSDSNWAGGRLPDGARSPDLSGPFKNVYQNHFVFVVGTRGTQEENLWAANKARYDAETLEYRGNGSVDIVLDSQYKPDTQRNAILYGNADTNSAWKALLGSCPIQVTREKVTVGKVTVEGNGLAAMFVYPHKAHGKWILIGAISGTQIEGLRTTERLGIFSGGVAYPDWTVLSSSIFRFGSKGVLGCGFFTNDWKISEADSAWNLP